MADKKKKNENIESIRFAIDFKSEEEKQIFIADCIAKNQYFDAIESFVVCLNHKLTGHWIREVDEKTKEIYQDRFSKATHQELERFFSVFCEDDSRSSINVMRGNYTGKKAGVILPKNKNKNYGLNQKKNRPGDLKTKNEWKKLGHEVKESAKPDEYTYNSFPLYWKKDTIRTKLVENEDGDEMTVCANAELMRDLKKRGIFPIYNLPEKKSGFYYSGVVAVDKMKGQLASNKNVNLRYEEMKKEYSDFVEDNLLEHLQDKKESYNNLLEEIKLIFPTFNVTKSFLSSWHKRFKNSLLLGKKFKWSFAEEIKGVFAKYKHLFEDQDYFHLFSKEKQLAEKLADAKQNITSSSNKTLFPRFGKNHCKFKIFNKEGEVCVNLDGIEVKLIPHKRTHIFKVEGKELLVQRDSELKSNEIKHYDLSEISLSYDPKFQNFGLRFTKTRKIPNFQACRFFATTFGESTSKTENYLKDGNFLFLDLGISPLVTFSVYKFSTNLIDNYNHICYKHNQKQHESVVGYAKYELSDKLHSGRYYSQIYNTKKLLEKLSVAFSFYKKITELQLKDDKVIGPRKICYENIKDISGVDVAIFKRLNKSFKKPSFAALELCGETAENQIDFLLEQKQEFVNNLLKDIQDSFRVVEKKITKINNNRMQYKNSFDGSKIAHLMLVDSLLNFKKKLTYICAIALKKGERPKNKNNFNKLISYRQNLADDLLKKFVNYIKKLCIKYNIGHVVMEDLGAFVTTQENKKGLNRLLRIWRKAEFKNRLKNVLEKYNIEFDEIDARHSSQLNPEAYGKQMENWAGRESFCKGNKEKLWTEDGVLLNSDVAATKNLANRFFNRFKETYALKVVKKDYNNQKYNLIVAKGKRVQSWLKNNCGSEWCYISDEGQIIDITKKEYNIIDKAKTVGWEDYYRHPSGWLNKEAHKKIQNDFIEQGRARAKVGSKVPQPLAIT